VLPRVLVSSQYPASLVAIRSREPAVRLGWSVPRVRSDPFRSRATRLPAHGVVALARRLLPGRAARVIAAGHCDALMAHWRLVTPRLVEAVHGAGGELYVWTVDELPLMRSIEALGVTGVISNDPRLFAALG
jgi:glycerophosphoryl diester phosphodiesterase